MGDDALLPGPIPREVKRRFDIEIARPFSNCDLKRLAVLRSPGDSRRRRDRSWHAESPGERVHYAAILARTVKFVAACADEGKLTRQEADAVHEHGLMRGGCWLTTVPGLMIAGHDISSALPHPHDSLWAAMSMGSMLYDLQPSLWDALLDVVEEEHARKAARTRHR